MTDSDTKLRDRQNELLAIIPAIDEVLQSKAWQTLKELLWDKEIERTERMLLSEAKKGEPELKALYKLQGELSRTQRYDLKSYAEMLKNELQGIKDKLI